jgi:hypothetical protein
VGESTLDDESVSTVVSLVRMDQDEPDLRAVWLPAHHAATKAFITLVARHLTVSPESLEVQVTSVELRAALATAHEHFALRNVEGLSLNETNRRAVRVAID